jgi:hypothetical protein
MGNSQSSGKLLSDTGKTDLLEKIGDIAGNYASSLNFEELTNLFDDTYCSQIEILTKDVLDKNLNTVQIEYLAQHQQKGVDVDFTKVNDTTYVKHATNLKKNQQTRKNRLCAGLAKYFIKILRIYAAISKTLNPTYSEGSGEKLDIFGFHNINPDTYRMNEDSAHLNMKFHKLENICDLRIEILKSLFDEKLMANVESPQPPKQDLSIDNSKKGEIELTQQAPEQQQQAPEQQQQAPEQQQQQAPEQQQNNPDEIPKEINNFKPVVQRGGVKEPAFCNYKGKNLNEEHGIAQLEDLFKDKYNFTTKMYEMSPQSETEYKATIINMYKTFSNKNETPGEEIKTFADIKLEDYSNDPLCTTQLEDTDIKFGAESNTSFQKYANHLNSTISKTFAKYDLLLLILKEIFDFTINEKTNKTTVKLKKNISETKVNELFSKTREIITQLYIDCQSDFIKGISIYKSIVFSKLLERNKLREMNIKKDMQQLI